MTDRDTKTADLAALLEREGIAQARARALAEQITEQQAGSDPGTVYGDVDSLGLARIWERATFAGVRSMTLHIEAQAHTLAEDDGLLTVRVLDAAKWLEWDDEQDAAAGGLAGMVAALDALDVDPASVRERPGVQEVAPGVFLGPGRRETDAEAQARAEGLN